MRIPAANVETSLAPPAGGRPASTRAALKEVEARFVAALLDAALPKGTSTFGKGLAGSIAREKLVERIAALVADNGLLGIAGGRGGRAAMQPEFPGKPTP